MILFHPNTVIAGIVITGFLWLGAPASGQSGVPLSGQSVAEERISPIDWDRVASDADRAASIAPALNIFRTRNSQELASIRLPVLIPNTTVVEGNPRFRGQGNSYAVAYALPDASLSILGTSVFLSRPDDKALAQSGQGPNRIFDRSEDGTDLSFLKYGAAYVLRLSCTKPDDERCTKDTFLNKVADSLLVVGGKK
jgi:hypothetical protein